MRPLPRPGRINWTSLVSGLRVLLFCDSANSLTNRVRLQLQKQQALVHVTPTKCAHTMEIVAQEFKPDMIICPFLTARVPSSLYSTSDRPTLIVHPGIAGDHGMSSIDWALHDGKNEWGVTVLEAADEMDAGNIWSTENFSVRENSTKTGMYVGEVSDAVERCVMDAVSRFMERIPSCPVDYSSPEVKGKTQANMRRKDREVNWEMTAEKAATQVRMSDTEPGAVGQIEFRGKSINMRLFDACVETGHKSDGLRTLLARARPGDLIGKKNEAVLIKAGDDKGLWIGHVRKDAKIRCVKMTASHFLESSGLDTPPELQFESDFNDIRVDINGPICKVHFDFYNGGMTPQQGRRLEATLKAVAVRDDVTVVALMGGDRLFSTGINLCDIETSFNKEEQSLRTINQIDDVIRAMFSMTNKLTVAVLQGNAGAGGAMMAAAADVVVTHPGVLLTPSYKNIRLTGSEYWTYFLPQRVGHVKAEELVNTEVPINAEEAKSIGLLDDIIGKSKIDFLRSIDAYLTDVLYSGKAELLIHKKRHRDSEWFKKLEEHRHREIEQMKKDFVSEGFRMAMRDFLYPAHNALNGTKSDKKLCHVDLRYKGRGISG